MCQLRAVWRDGRWNVEGTATPVVSLRGFVGEQDCLISSSDGFLQNNPANVCLVQAGSWLLQGMSVLSARPQQCHTALCILALMDRWVWVSNCGHSHSLFLQEKPPLELGQKTQTPSWTGWQLAWVFLRWNTDFDKGVLFVYNNGSTLRISAAAWIPPEDAEEPVHPVSMETHAGGGGCRTREEQEEAK